LVVARCNQPARLKGIETVSAETPLVIVSSLQPTSPLKGH